MEVQNMLQYSRKNLSLLSELYIFKKTEWGFLEIMTTLSILQLHSNQVEHCWHNHKIIVLIWSEIARNNKTRIYSLEVIKAYITNIRRLLESREIKEWQMMAYDIDNR